MKYPSAVSKIIKKIAVLDDYQNVVRELDSVKLLEGVELIVFTDTVKTVDQLVDRLHDAQALVLIEERSSISRELLSQLPNLQLIAQVGKVGAHIDVQACTDHGVAITTSSHCPVPSAEFVWALIMSAMRRLPQYVEQFKLGAWQQSGLSASHLPPKFSIGSSLRGRTLGIWGYDGVARILAKYGKTFEMQVRVWGDASARSRAQLDDVATFESKEDFFTDSDVASLHVRLSEQTQHMISVQDLAQMKPTALFVNIAHARLLEPNALVTALQQGRPGMAAVDVFETEPTQSKHPLLALANCICTPHISTVEQDIYERYFGSAFKNIVSFIQGQPQHIANRQVLQPLEHDGSGL